jgi:lipid-A-disaccharide synthase
VGKEVMQQKSEFILIVAGEDSGDVIGEDVVREVLEEGFEAWGTGGTYMKGAGLKTLANFEDMAVNGFFDVLKKLPKLFLIKKKLSKMLRSENCIALICIDYPGMNLPLAKLSKKINKPVFYIAPPQIWAWKKNRGKHFKNINVGVFFEFEKNIYESFGAYTVLIKHPCLKNTRICDEFKDKVLFLPGSRLGQLKRNLKKYMSIAKNEKNAVFVASRKELFDFLNKKLDGKFPVILKESGASFAGAKAAVCTPGTAVLETWLAGVPTTAVAVIDPITYIMGKIFLKTKYLTLPNIIMQKEVVKEYVFPNFFTIIFLHLPLYVPFAIQNTLCQSLRCKV